MNVPAFAFAAVFLALSAAFLAQAKKETDAAKARNARLAGWLTLAAGLVTFGVALFAYFGGGR